MLSTLGDTLEVILARVFYKSLVYISFLLMWAGYGLARAGPLLSSNASKLKCWAENKLIEDDKTARPKKHFSNKSNPSSSQIEEAPMPEAQPGKEDKEKIQITPLSTETGGSDDTLKEVTQSKTDDGEETFKSPVTIGDLIKAQMEDTTRDEKLGA